MGSFDSVSHDRHSVEVDDRGRVTIPIAVREGLGIFPGDELALDVVEAGLCLQPTHGGLVTVTSQKTEWGPEAFPDSGEATFGGGVRDQG